MVSLGVSGGIMALIGFSFFVSFITGIKNVKIIGLNIALIFIIGLIFTGTDNAAHIGGLLSGIIIGIIYKLYRWKQWKG